VSCYDLIQALIFDKEEGFFMVKKLNKLVGDGGQFAAAVRDSANQIWLAGLGAFATAQKEGTKIFEALVKEGESAQHRAAKAAEESWGKLEKVFEDRVGRALHTFSVPTKKDIDTLSHRVAELTAVTKKISQETRHPRA
jgi:polyhydroxyalkanoate synthesis regulator phasin